MVNEAREIVININDVDDEADSEDDPDVGDSHCDASLDDLPRRQKIENCVLNKQKNASRSRLSPINQRVVFTQ